MKKTERGAEIEFLKFFDESKIESIKQTLDKIMVGQNNTK